VENKFFWGIEQSGIDRKFRILQKRGQFVDAEDFLVLTKTYPEHPLTKVEVKAATLAEMKQQRKD